MIFTVPQPTTFTLYRWKIPWQRHSELNLQNVVSSATDDNATKTINSWALCKAAGAQGRHNCCYSSYQRF